MLCVCKCVYVYVCGSYKYKIRKTSAAEKFAKNNTNDRRVPNIENDKKLDMRRHIWHEDDDGSKDF